MTIFANECTENALTPRFNVDITLDFKLFYRKTNMLILSGFREDLIGVTMFPAALNTRLDGVLGAQMHFKQLWSGILPHYSTTGNGWRYEVTLLAHLTLTAPHRNS